jgi:DNA uptake protein ComE-like DNA-binding protein
MPVAIKHPSYQPMEDNEVNISAFDSKNPEKMPVQGQALHERFKDSLDTQIYQMQKKETMTVSDTKKITSGQIDLQQMVSPKLESKKLDEMAIAKAEPIGAIPVIDKPQLQSNGDLSLERSVPKLTSLKKETNAVDTLSLKDRADIISKISPKTMNEIYAIILKEQLEIQKNGANLAQDCYSKLIDLRKLHERSLEDIRKALEKDENISSWLKTGQTVAVVAGAIVGFGALIVSIVASGGVAIPAAIATIATVGPYVTAGLNALVAGGKGYADYRTNEDKAKLTEFQHVQKKSNALTDDYHELIGSTAEKHEEHAKNLIQNSHRLKKIQSIAIG